VTRTSGPYASLLTLPPQHFEKIILGESLMRYFKWELCTLLFLAVWSCLCAVGQSAENVSADIRKAASRVRQIVAHRGASKERPECTLASLRRAIEVGATAVEVDVRTSKDGHLMILHDNTLDRTTNGTGPIGQKTLAELKQLDAGTWFAKKYRNERIPTLIEVLKVAKGKIDVLLDLKEQGDEYDRKVIALVQKYGEPKRIIVGVRTVEQAKRFRKLLPPARQLGLIPKPESIDAFAKAGVETIRLWPRWLTDSALVPRVKRAEKKLHLNGRLGTAKEIIPLLQHSPDSLSSDDPGKLVKTLKQLSK
jgi:glycerophosphoryl diester phosphodiesterase